MNLTCVLNPFACFNGTLDAQPWYWLVGIGLVVGLVLGAWLGKWGVAAVLGVVAFLAIWRRTSDNPIEQFPDGHPDAKPSHPKPGKPIGDDWFSRVRRGD